MVSFSDSGAAFVVARVPEEPSHQREFFRGVVILLAFLVEREEAVAFEPRRVGVLTYRVGIGPTVVVVPADRDDLLLLGVPLDPDEITGLEDLVFGGFQDTRPRRLISDGLRDDVRMARREMTVLRIHEVTKGLEITVLHGVRERRPLDRLAWVDREFRMQVALGVKPLTCALAAAIRRPIAIVEAVVVRVLLATLVVSEVSRKQL